MEQKNLMLDTLVWAALCAAVVTQTGCAALVGIKEYKGSDGSVIKFVTGFDVGATATALDSKDDRQGINSKDLR